MRAHDLVASFNAGELSPLLQSRTDLAQYRNGCSKLRNFIPTVQGAVVRRGGQRYVSEVRDSDVRCWFGRFEFTSSQAYVIEFSPGFVRFYTQRAVLQDAGTPIEVATPWDAGDLTTSEGTFALDIEQRGDVLYIVSANHPPQTLTRVSPTSWVLAPFVTQGGPLLDVNANEALRLSVAAQTGSSVVVTASAAAFTQAHVGALLRIDLENIVIPPWEPAKAPASGSRRRSDGKTYLAIDADGTRITGSKTPIHEQGQQPDGSGVTTDTVPKNIGIVWKFEDAGYGIGTIVSVEDSTHCTVAVDPQFPYPFDLIANPSNIWQFGAWGAHNEYPAHVFFWKGRLGFAGKRTTWLSVPRGYNDFSRDIVGEVRADAGITAEIETTQGINYVAPSAQLLVGTEKSEFLIRKGTESEALGPANIDADEATDYGSRRLKPVRGGNGVFFTDRSGRRVRHARTSDQTGEYEAPDMTVLSEHITGAGIVDWAWQNQPHRVLWCVLADGSLVGLTLEREQQVQCWHPHTTRGYYEAVEVIPSPDGKRDDVWFIVRRVVGGQVKRFVEYMERGYERGMAQSDAFFVDAGLTYSGAPATTISGLDHLAGETVEVVADGAAHPACVVSATGTITLDNPASTVHAGLHSAAVVIPMPFEVGAGRGTSQGKTKRIDHVQARFIDTLGGKVGPNEDNLEPIPTRTSQDPGGAAPALFNGVVTISTDHRHEELAEVAIVQDQPLPMTITALMPEVTTYERES